MGNTLTLSEIAPYLPYGLKCKDIMAMEDDDTIEIRGFYINDNVPSFYDEHGNFDIKPKDIKPYLRPLSSLTKEITVNGETFVPIDRINEDFTAEDSYTFDGKYLMWRPENNSSYNMLCLPLDVIIFIYSLHFDLHGLIERGLALPIED